MRPARLAVAPQQSVFLGFDVNENDGVVAAKMLQQTRQFLELQPFASIHQEGRPLQIPFTGSMQLREYRHQFDRQIVDTVVAHVLKSFKNGALPGTGKSGKDDELAANVSSGS